MAGFSSRLRAGTVLGSGLFNRSASAGPRRLLIIAGVGVGGLATVAIIATSGHKIDTPSRTVGLARARRHGGLGRAGGRHRRRYRPGDARFHHPGGRDRPVLHAAD